jgi:hypothetical protein
LWFCIGFYAHFEAKLTPTTKNQSNESVFDFVDFMPVWLFSCWVCHRNGYFHAAIFLKKRGLLGFVKLET